MAKSTKANIKVETAIPVEPAPLQKRRSLNPFKKIGKIDKELMTPLSIVLAGIIIAGSIMLTGYSFGKKTALVTPPSLESLQAQMAANNQAAPTNPNPLAQLDPAKVDRITADDHVRGDAGARILLIEYSDLECPFCKTFHPTAQKIFNEYQGQVAWVYRHFPIDQLHSKARKEAEASECAAEQGGSDAFWKFVDKVFEVTPANNGLEPSQLPVIAAGIGLDGPKLQTCIDSGKMAAKIQAQIASGTKIGIAGTPTSVLLDTKTNKAILIPGALPYEDIKSKIDSLLSGS